MNIEIREHFKVEIYGFEGVAVNKDYVTKAFSLSDRMWKVVKGSELKHKGINIWVYDDNEKVFAGVELEEKPTTETELERKTIHLARYAYYKHIGAYDQIKNSGQKMIAELNSMGCEITQPYMEIYGHWTNDTAKLETELFMCLK